MASMKLTLLAGYCVNALKILPSLRKRPLEVNEEVEKKFEKLNNKS